MGVEKTALRMFEDAMLRLWMLLMMMIFSHSTAFISEPKPSTQSPYLNTARDALIARLRVPGGGAFVSAT